MPELPFVPLLCGLVGGAAAYAAAEWMLPHPGPHQALLIGGTNGVTVSAAVMWLVAQDLVSGMIEMIRSLVFRRAAAA